MPAPHRAYDAAPPWHHAGSGITSCSAPNPTDKVGHPVPIRCRMTVALAAAALFPAVSAQQPSAQRFPDVIAVDVRHNGHDVFDFDGTVSTPYDTPGRYADAFRVATQAGKRLGERKLLHDRRAEQPFTRDLHGVRIPAMIKAVVVQARDQRHGYGGKSVIVALPGR